VLYLKLFKSLISQAKAKRLLIPPIFKGRLGGVNKTQDWLSPSPFGRGLG